MSTCDIQPFLIRVLCQGHPLRLSHISGKYCRVQPLCRSPAKACKTYRSDFCTSNTKSVFHSTRFKRRPTLQNPGPASAVLAKPECSGPGRRAWCRPRYRRARSRSCQRQHDAKRPQAWFSPHHKKSRCPAAVCCCSCQAFPCRPSPQAPAESKAPQPIRHCFWAAPCDTRRRKIPFHPVTFFLPARLPGRFPR